jgi:hypothetical protein
VSKAETEAAWDSAVYNAERARKAEAEVERLRQAVIEDRGEYQRERMRLGAEVDRLRAALREIVQTTEDIPEQNCALASLIARAALRVEEEK